MTISVISGYEPQNRIPSTGATDSGNDNEALTQCHNHAPFDPAAHQPTEKVECSLLESDRKCDKFNNRS
jgi:hypothetical protein